MSNLNIKYLEAFVFTAEYGTFSDAARKLGKVQSVISTAIANLEIDIGQQLFDRKGRYPVLTEAGRLLLPEAKLILSKCQQFETAAFSLNQTLESQVTIAIDEHLSAGALTQRFAEFSEKYPLVQLNLVHPIRQGVAEVVRSGDAHLGIIQKGTNIFNELRTLPHSKQNMNILVHKSHALVDKESVDLDDLAMFRQVVLNRSEEAKRDPMVIASKVWFTESAFTAANMILSGCCWGIMPEFIYTNWAKADQLTLLNVKETMSSWNMDIDVIWHRSSKIGPATSWWINSLSQKN
ncbi:LysR family transcriptional regulator [Vibrio sp. MACH09]|uniref:LysR family transcriptional regulator n=1 Tax=Vibrio sp. MACH09 TaxID=3025122 RepID=UPI00278CD76D|nr:LysR family transcriptional regulator [Vibrio sp. MACH09]GLO62411.1 LysR family transcriptional regulator [Vibrio sp. MACH09]